MADGAIAGAEALVRWQHPEVGLLSPAAFLARAERTGFVRALTAAVLSESLRQFRRWSAAGHHVPVAVNLSPVLLDDLSLPDEIERLTLEGGVAPADVTLEVTESVAVARRQLAMDVLTRLRLKGFRLALDDFGVGFSSLIELQHMPFTELKIDKSFVAEAVSDPSARAIVDAVIGLAHRLSLRIVAEGIETQPIWSLLKAAGCDVGQGFLISRPLDTAGFDAFLARRESRPRVRIAARS
jgi:EAL domain-containing protein (putative c-di-GMP-specific phosphodiesterase class I)